MTPTAWMPTYGLRPLRALVLALALPGGAALGHEFWIDPLEFMVPEGAPLQAHLRVGQDFKGSAYSFVPPQIQRFDLALGDDLTPVEGRPGDRPALNMALPDQDGLVSVAHVTSDMRLVYDSWQQFTDFTVHKDFEWALEAHTDRGFSQDKVIERYTRYAKSLIALGDGQGADRALGLEVELIGGANPYTDTLDGVFPVTLHEQGAPLADAQIELFDKAPDGSVETRLYRTDGNGVARLDVAPGHVYLVDHVVMRPLTPEQDGDPAWHSLWASLTFSVPQD